MGLRGALSGYIYPAYTSRFRLVGDGAQDGAEDGGSLVNVSLPCKWRDGDAETRVRFRRRQMEFGRKDKTSCSML